MREFPFDDDRLTLFGMVSSAGFVDTLRALADVADTLAGHPPGLPEDPDTPLPHEARADARALAVRLRALAADTRRGTLLP